MAGALVLQARVLLGEWRAPAYSGGRGGGPRLRCAPHPFDGADLRLQQVAAAVREDTECDGALSAAVAAAGSTAAAAAGSRAAGWPGRKSLQAGAPSPA